MNIGIDIDGVLTDVERATIDYGTKMCTEENWPINIDVSKYRTNETFNWTEEREDKFWNKYIEKYFAETAPREFISEIIKKLQQEGNEIYIITARDAKQCKNVVKLTKKWLKKHKIDYKKLIFSKDEEKIQHCIENNIDVMIEDSPRNILDISSKIKVIKFDCQYNKDITNENVITAYSWYHIYKIIKEMKGE